MSKKQSSLFSFFNNKPAESAKETADTVVGETTKKIVFVDESELLPKRSAVGKTATAKKKLKKRSLDDDDDNDNDNDNNEDDDGIDDKVVEKKDDKVNEVVEVATEDTASTSTKKQKLTDVDANSLSKQFRDEIASIDIEARAAAADTSISQF